MTTRERAKKVYQQYRDGKIGKATVMTQAGWCLEHKTRTVRGWIKLYESIASILRRVEREEKGK